jgi:hypothetical protein
VIFNGDEKLYGMENVNQGNKNLNEQYESCKSIELLEVAVDCEQMGL